MPETAPSKVSTTAILVAAVRASHLRWDPAPIFADDYAISMVTPFWRLVVNNWLLNRLMVNVLLRTLKPTHTVIILRIRYAEDRLWETISAGVHQYVILGAGLDTFALRARHLTDQLRIYEVDHPASQEMKRNQLERIGGWPSNLKLVPVDFETDRLDDALIGAGFNLEAPAFFSWLGVTCYLTREAISGTIDQVAAVTAPGSRLVLDYRYPERLVPADGLALVKKMDRFVRAPGRADAVSVQPRGARRPDGASRLRGDGSRLSRRAGAALPAGAPRHTSPTSQLRFHTVQKEVVAPPSSPTRQAPGPLVASGSP